ncbi:hypothetical protein VDG1235_4177 [Verrucomicrobiia bacterium DG1235]|nr:hypothetical protein VDG1235_4177 [Verrucomicrobiae bacterium DG1235]
MLIYPFALCLILCSLPSSSLANTFPLIGSPSWTTGNTSVSKLEFLTPQVVQFHTQAGVSVWRIDSGEELVSESRPSQAPVIDYEYESDTQLILDSGKLYLKTGDSPDLLPIGDPENNYMEANFTQDGQTVLATGRHTSLSDQFIERLSIVDGTRLWFESVNSDTHFHAMSETGRIAILERTVGSSWHDRLSLIDETTGQTIVSGDISAAHMTDFSQSYIDPLDRLIVAAGNGDTVYFLNAISNTLVEANYGSLGFYPRYHAPEMSLDASRIILQFGGSFEPIRIINTLTGETIADVKDIPLNTSQFFQTSFNLSPDGESLYILTAPGRIEKWDLDSHSSIRTFTHTNVPFTHLLLTPDESILLAARSTGRENDYIVAFNTSDSSLRYNFLRPFALTLAGSGFVTSPSETLKLSPDGRYLYFSSSNSTHFFDLDDGAETNLLPATYGQLLGSAYISNRSNYLLIYKSGVMEERSGTDFSIVNKGLYPNFRFTDDLLLDESTGRALLKIGGGLHALDTFTGQIIWSAPDFGFDAGYYDFGANGEQFILTNPSETSGVFDIEENAFVLDFSNFENGGAWEHALSHDGTRYGRITTDIEDTNNKQIEIYSIPEGDLLYRSESFADIDSLQFLDEPNEILFVAQQDSSDKDLLRTLKIDTSSQSILSETPFKLPEDKTIASTSLSTDQTRLFIMTLDDTLYTVDLATHKSSTPLKLRSTPIDYYRDSSISTNTDGSTYLFVGREALAEGGQIQTARLLSASIEESPAGLLVTTSTAEQATAYQMQVSDNLVEWSDQGEPLTADPAIPPAWNFDIPENGILFGRIIGIE